MLREHSSGSGNFLSIKHHGICLESKEPKEGYEQIEVTNPRTDEVITKWIKKYAAVSGIVHDLEWYDRDQFKGLKIYIKDGGERYILDLPVKTRHFDSFTKLAENIDYSKPVEFSAWHDRKTDKTAFGVKQDGNFVQWKYTKDNMGDCPPAKQSKTTGEWSFNDQREWLLDRVLNVVAPHVKALHGFDEPMPEYTDDDLVSDAQEKVVEKVVAKKSKAKAAPADPLGDFSERDLQPAEPDDTDSELPF